MTEPTNEFKTLESMRSVLRSRLYSRMIQYDLFIFGDQHAAVNVHLSTNSVNVTVPFIVEIAQEHTLVYSGNDIYETSSPAMAVGVIAKLVRMLEQRTKRFKQN